MEFYFIQVKVKYYMILSNNVCKRPPKFKKFQYVPQFPSFTRLPYWPFIFGNIRGLESFNFTPMKKQETQPQLPPSDISVILLQILDHFHRRTESKLTIMWIYKFIFLFLWTFKTPILSMNKTSDESKPNAQISFKMHHSNTVTKGQARTKFISFNVVIGKERNWKLDSAHQIWRLCTSVWWTLRGENYDQFPYFIFDPIKPKGMEPKEEMNRRDLLFTKQTAKPHIFFFPL